MKPVKYKDLKIGQYFKYQGMIFRKTKEVDMGSCIYNAITDEVFGEAYIRLILDDTLVYPRMKNKE